MSALVLGSQPLNANSRTMTREQHAMLHEREVATRRVQSARDFLGPMADADARNAWEKKMACRHDDKVAAEEKAAADAEKMVALEARRARLEALYAGDVAAWTGELDPKKERAEGTKKRLEAVVEVRGGVGRP